MLFEDSKDSYKLLFGENIEEDLVTIEILGQNYRIPRSINLLRGFHYIALRTDIFDIQLRKHCWSGSCENCRCSFIDEQLGEAEGLACQMKTDETLVITRLPETMAYSE